MNSNLHLLPYFDRVLVMDEGRIVGDGSPEDVRAKFPWLLTTLLQSPPLSATSAASAISPKGLRGVEGGDIGQDFASQHDDGEADDEACNDFTLVSKSGAADHAEDDDNESEHLSTHAELERVNDGVDQSHGREKRIKYTERCAICFND